MADLHFRKGIHSTMPSTISEGTIYVTTDEKAMYVDISATERIRLGQIISYNTYADFRKLAQPPYSTEAFYYIADENALLKWVLKKDSTTEYEWRQINNVSDITANITDLQNDVNTLKGNVGDLAAADTAFGKKINVITYGQETKPEGAEDAGENLNLNKLKTDLATAQSTAAQGVSDAAAAQATANQGVTDAAAAQSTANEAKTQANTNKDNISTINGQIQAINNSLTGEDGLNGKVADLTTRMGTVETGVTNNAAAAKTAKDAADAAQGTANAAKKQADTNKGNISTINTAINGENGINAKITDLTTRLGTAEGNISTNTSTIATVKTTAEKGVSDAAAAKGVADGAAAQAAQNKTDIGTLTATVASNKTAAETDATTKANAAEANAKAYTDKEIADKLKAADAMVFKGTVDASHALPTSEVRVGDTYKVAAKGTYAGQSAYVGDLFIAQGTESAETGFITGDITWAFVPSGYTADYNPHLTGGAISTANNKTAIENAIHLTSGSAAANTYGDLGIVKFASSNSNLTVSVANTNTISATVNFGLVWEDWQ